MMFSIVLGDTGFLGSAFSRALIDSELNFIGLNRHRIAVVNNGIRNELPRKSPDLFTEIEPFLSEDCVVINTVWGKNNREFRDSTAQQANSNREVSLIERLNYSKVQYLSFGSIAEIDDCEISPSCGTEYARAKRLVAEHLLHSELNSIWIRVASSYGPNDLRDWLFTQLQRNWENNTNLHLENPNQLLNLYYVDSLVSASLELIYKKKSGVFNASSIQWVTVGTLKECFNNLQEPEYIPRTSGSFSSGDLNRLLISSPPISEYFARCQKFYKS
jgi:nucleoside-diphosphate-sugar epimerase